MKLTNWEIHTPTESSNPPRSKAQPYQVVIVYILLIVTFVLTLMTPLEHITNFCNMPTFPQPSTSIRILYPTDSALLKLTTGAAHHAEVTTH